MAEGVRGRAGRGAPSSFSSRSAATAAVRPELYEGGRAALEAGAVAGHDLTVEAAIAKSMHLLGQGLSGTRSPGRLTDDLAGEITVDPPEAPRR